MAELNLLFKNRNVPGIENLDVYEANGGYAGLKKAVAMERQAVIDEVKASGLRGRGGAGFPTWIKWNGLPKNYDAPHYVICNADEGEPGTYKDRELMLKLAHTLVEGMIIAGYATHSIKGFVYIRGEYVEPAWQVRKAIDQAYKAGYLGKNISGYCGLQLRPVYSDGRGQLRVRRRVRADEQSDGRTGQSAPEISRTRPCRPWKASGSRPR